MAQNFFSNTNTRQTLTELITITIATTTYPEKKKWVVSIMEEFFSLDIVSTGDIWPKCICPITTVQNDL